MCSFLYFITFIKCASSACDKEDLPLQYFSTNWILIRSEEKKKKSFAQENSENIWETWPKVMYSNSLFHLTHSQRYSVYFYNWHRKKSHPHPWEEGTGKCLALFLEKLSDELFTWKNQIIDNCWIIFCWLIKQLINAALHTTFTSVEAKK